jgi:hypothetical protein
VVLSLSGINRFHRWINNRHIPAPRAKPGMFSMTCSSLCYYECLYMPQSSLKVYATAPAADDSFLKYLAAGFTRI